MVHSRYIRLLLTWFAVFGAAGIAINLLIDPMGISPIGLNIRGLNAIRTERLNADRLIKPFDILLRRPETLLIGTSRTKEGLDPDDEPRLHAYNAGMDSASLLEGITLLENSLRFGAPIRRVFFEITPRDLSNVPSSLPSTDTTGTGRFPRDFPEYARNYFDMIATWAALKRSIRTVIKNYAYGRAILVHRNGLGDPWSVRHIYQGFLSVADHGCDWRDAVIVGLRQVDFLDRLARLRDQYNIQMTVYIPPISPLVFTRDFICGYWGYYDALKRALADRFDTYDFAQFTRFSYEPITDRMTYWRDWIHYSPVVGKHILAIFAGHRQVGTPPDFGRRLAPDTVDDELAAARIGRDAWIADHPRIFADIKQHLNE